MDYVVGNFGLNTKYHASAEHPALIYFGDFEKNGRMQIVEAEFEGDKLFPIRGRSCSTKAMPTLGGKFQSYRQFASAELDQVYDDACLAKAKRYAANTLETGILLNDGSGRFQFQPLPRLAQIAPVFGVGAGDFDGDGSPDLFLAQNFYSPQPETGRMDGGMGLLLRGTASGTFVPSSPTESGIVLPNDCRSAVVTDLNDDNRPDVVVATNDGPVRSWINQDADSHRFVRVELIGPAGNPRCHGSRVTVNLSNAKRQTVETSAGGGYLAQGTARQSFGVPKGTKVKSVDVRWPDGKMETIHSVDDKQVIRISHALGSG